MQTVEQERERYPRGRLTFVTDVDDGQRELWIAEIEALPAQLRAAAGSLTDAQLDTPYRAGGWTVRQVVHHVPDSHMNGYIRFCLALTEDHPTIRPYDQDAWSKLEYARTAPVSASLGILDALHARWCVMLRQQPASAWQRTLHHPESGDLTLDHLLQVYAWHSRHHLGHVTEVAARLGW